MVQTTMTPKEQCEEHIKRIKADLYINALAKTVYKFHDLNDWILQITEHNLNRELQSTEEYLKNHIDQWGRWIHFDEEGY